MPGIAPARIRWIRSLAAPAQGRTIRPSACARPTRRPFGPACAVRAQLPVPGPNAHRLRPLPGSGCVEARALSPAGPGERRRTRRTRSKRIKPRRRALRPPRSACILGQGKPPHGSGPRPIGCGARPYATACSPKQASAGEFCTLRQVGIAALAPFLWIIPQVGQARSPRERCPLPCGTAAGRLPTRGSHAVRAGNPRGVRSTAGPPPRLRRIHERPKPPR